MITFETPDNVKIVCPIKTSDLNGRIFIGSYQCRMCENNIAIDTDLKTVKCSGQITDVGNLYRHMYPQNHPKEPRILHMTLKEKWFLMHSSREKLIDYRDIKYSWFKKLFFKRDGFDHSSEVDAILDDMKELYTTLSGHEDLQDLMNFYGLEFQQYDFILYRNGYGKNAPQTMVKFSGVSIGTAKPEWIDEGLPNKNYFRIWDGEIVQTKNHKQ